MDAAAAFFEARSKSWNVDSLFNFNHLNRRVQLHLQKVYTTLCVAVLVAALGVYAHMLTHLGGLLTTMGFLGCTMWLMSTPSYEEGKRYKILMGAAFLEGASFGTLIEFVLNYDPSIVVTALLGSVAIFACFSGAAVFAKRREFLFLGAILSSVVSTMLMLQFGSYIFGGSSAMFNVELYGGLLLFVGYVLFDTQLIIERADKGDEDYIKHSLDLFMDFVSIFVRILIILSKNSSEKTREERKKRRS
jgi:FtsH-binding integral membrane protein